MLKLDCLIKVFVLLGVALLAKNGLIKLLCKDVI